MEEMGSDLNSTRQKMEDTDVEKVEGSLSDGVKFVWAGRVEKRTRRMGFFVLHGKRQKPIQIQQQQRHPGGRNMPKKNTGGILRNQ